MADICFLVLTHRLPETLALLDLMRDERFFFVVHFDARAQVNLAPLARRPDVLLIEDRLTVHWGGFSMAQAVLRMLDAAAAHAATSGRTFARTALISGDALPLYPLDTLHERLSDPEIEFLDLKPIQAAPELRGTPMGGVKQTMEGIKGAVQSWRFANYVALDSVLTNPRDTAALEAQGFSAKQIAFIRQQASALAEQIFSTLPDRPPLFPRLFAGSTWWGLGPQALDHLRAEAVKPDIAHYFRFMRNADEHIFPTVLGNWAGISRRRQRLMFTNWQKRRRENNPNVSFADLAAGRRQEFLFARKYEVTACPDITAALKKGRYFEQIADQG